MKNPVRRNKVICFFLAAFALSASTFAGDIPIDRDFLKLPDQRWIWLEKVGWHETRVILGKGEKSFKNKIWSSIYETDGRHHTWAYAFFVKIRPGRFVESDGSGRVRVAVSTTDLGNNVIRHVIVYRVMSDRLEIETEVSGFNAAADGPVFSE